MDSNATPPPFDALLIVMTVPLVIAAGLFLVYRVREIRRDRCGLTDLLVALAFMVAAVQYVVRPLADIWGSWGVVERVTAPLARVVVFCVIVTILWTDISKDD